MNDYWLYNAQYRFYFVVAAAAAFDVVGAAADMIAGYAQAGKWIWIKWWRVCLMWFRYENEMYNRCMCVLYLYSRWNEKWDVQGRLN